MLDWERFLLFMYHTRHSDLRFEDTIDVFRRVTGWDEKRAADALQICLDNGYVENVQNLAIVESRLEDFDQPIDA